MSENEQKAGCVGALAIAGMARKHFGNPIPDAAYAFARELLEAAALSPARSGEAVAGLVKRWREAADWLDSFGDDPTMHARAEGFRACADALEELA